MTQTEAYLLEKGERYDIQMKSGALYSGVLLGTATRHKHGIQVVHVLVGNLCKYHQVDGVKVPAPVLGGRNKRALVATGIMKATKTDRWWKPEFLPFLTGAQLWNI